MGFAFQRFVVDTEACKLFYDGEEVPLERRAFDLLRYLVEREGRLVTKQELLEEVWGAHVLSEGVLSNTVSKLRRALGQGSRDKHPIETVHGRGYRFRDPTRAASSVSEPPQPEARSPGPPEARATESDPDPFVGRDRLMQTLLQRVEAPHRGQENLVVLSGEAGIGKTRITRELAACGRERDVGVWTGASHEGDGAPPYWPWIQILRQAREEMSDVAWRDCLPRDAWAMAHLLPSLSLQAGPAPQVEPETARFHLFEEVAHVLANASAHRPRLVILDDLQWADTASIELLASVARALQEHPVTLVATLRTGASAPHEGDAIMERIGRVATQITLDHLSVDEVSQMAEAMFGGTPLDPAQSRTLHERTRGNPLFVRHALHLIAHRDGAASVEGVTSVTNLPPAIRHVIRQRLEALPQATRSILEAAAVMGETFHIAILADVLQSDDATVLEGLDPALRSGLLEQRGPTAERFAFTHALVRDSLYDEIPLRRRGELHARAAHARSEREQRDHPTHLGEIAHHRLHAVPFDVSAAVDACLRAAVAAREASGFESATDLLTRAIARLDGERLDPSTRCRLLLELGENHFYAGHLDSAWNAFRDAAAAARTGENSRLLAEVAPRLTDCLELAVGDERFARDVVEKALDGLHEQDVELRASLLAQRAELALELAPEQRMGLLDEAAGLAERSQSPAAVLEVAHSRAIIRDPKQLDENDVAAARFLELVDRYPEAAAGMRYRSLRRFGAHLTRYLCALTRCDLAAADAALLQCRHVADTSHVRAACFAVDLMECGRALGDGRLDELERRLDTLGPPTYPMSAPASLARAGYLLALNEVRDTAEPEMAASFPDLDMPSRGAARDVTLAQARQYAHRGHLEHARALVARIPADVLSRMPVQHGDLGVLCWLAEIYRRTNDHDGARSLYDQLSPYAALNSVGPTFEYLGAVAFFLALLCRVLDDEAGARAHLRHALEINRELGIPFQVARVERELGEGEP